MDFDKNTAILAALERIASALEKANELTKAEQDATSAMMAEHLKNAQRATSLMGAQMARTSPPGGQTS